ncbi:MAG: SLC13 family permease [Phycisphaerae bacterium]
MNVPQIITFLILIITLVLFAWNRWRFDIVAIGALLTAAILGIIPSDEVFSGFAHPAVITVVAVLVLSRGLLNAGVVDVISQQLGKVGNRPTIQALILTGIVAICSGFMNNVGALALMMPVAIWMSRKSGRSPSLLLMPIAFGSLLGGMLTLIGTPPNMIIAAYRSQADSSPFGMFDFLPVGIVVAGIGVIFISIIGWRLIPKPTEQGDKKELFEVSEYISEVRVPEKSKFVGLAIHDLISSITNKEDITVVGLVRDAQKILAPSMYRVLKAGDILLLESDSETLKNLIDSASLELFKGQEEYAKGIVSEDISVIEAVVTPDSFLIGRTISSLSLRDRYGINVIAVARRGKRLTERLSRIRFMAADILLLQGGAKSLPSTLFDLGCLPLAERGLRIGKPRKVLLSIGIFASAMTLTALNILPAHISLTCAAVIMMITGLLLPAEAYKSIDWPVVVLLGAMIPIGQAFETTGGAELIATKLQWITGNVSLALTLIMLMTATMLLSNIINNAAAAILMAPIAVNLANSINASIDPFLMTIAIGASAAFMTPIGHQSNALVMEPGGYKFGDYWRMGLPLSIIVIAVGVPVILYFWLI